MAAKKEKMLKITLVKSPIGAVPKNRAKSRQWDLPSSTSPFCYRTMTIPREWSTRSCRIIKEVKAMELSNLKPAEGSKNNDNFRRGSTVFHVVVNALKNIMQHRSKFRHPYALCFEVSLWFLLCLAFVAPCSIQFYSDRIISGFI